MTQRSSRTPLILLACAALLWPLCAVAQEAEEAPPPPAPSGEGAQEVAASSVVEYFRGAFRDPFRSLKEPKIEDERPRPPGPPGMLIEEIDVVGVLSGPKGAMVLILGSDGLGYSLTEGSKLYDGVTLRIRPDEGLVVFRQNVNDPNRIKPYRDIERRLDSGS
jgi:hypothetical protein